MEQLNEWIELYPHLSSVIVYYYTRMKILRFLVNWLKFFFCTYMFTNKMILYCVKFIATKMQVNKNIRIRDPRIRNT
jgi:hypothetical protein